MASRCSQMFTRRAWTLVTCLRPDRSEFLFANSHTVTAAELRLAESVFWLASANRLWFHMLSIWLEMPLRLVNM